MNPIFCKHLRTKAMFTGSTPEEALGEKDGEDAAPRYCWCNRTQTVVGVDDRPVHRADCVPGRSCFEE